ncbi:ATP synthase protein I [Luteibacter sp. Sphag1AF]|uniref:ATP synthase subunit I n=1 Tax=Luteibacter sp. Sphag1AF TaxID=2587031 RepID=UPI00161355FC|nr:ATP synthase subunit I [Luteibacter sp. Sphag1AF]MBB3226388.1 ATP synthase protein I [Luteibacter sp. Sphag1AF]
MLNSLAASRRLAMRVVFAQLVVAVLVGIAFLLQGRSAGLAAFAGALIVALGNALFAARFFSTLGSATVATGRLLMGMFLKWIIYIGGILLVLAYWKLPPLAALTGLAAAFAVNVFAFRFKG